MKPIALIIALIFLAGPLWTPRLTPNVYEGSRSRNARDRLIRNSSAVAVILGEIRASTSDMLFIKTERYLDNGVAFEPHLEKELLSVSCESQANDIQAGEAAAPEDAHHDHAHEPGAEGEPPQTIIRTRDRDFRGIIGELERRVQPWHNPNQAHQHATGEQMLPWYRVMTLADPNNGRAYAIGSWWLKQKDHDEAIAFVEEGLKHNPEFFQLWYTYEILLYEKGRTLQGEAKIETGIPPEAQAAFNRAKEACLRATEFGLARRPAGWLPLEDESEEFWTLYEDEDLRAAARFATLLERDFGDKRKALALAVDLDKRLDGDYIVARQIPNLERRLASGQIEMMAPAEWERLVAALDELAEQAADHLDELSDAETRALAVRLIGATEAAADAAFPAGLANPSGVVLAQFDLIHAAERCGDPTAAPLADLRHQMRMFHGVVERLMNATGMPHAHDHDHNH